MKFLYFIFTFCVFVFFLFAQHNDEMTFSSLAANAFWHKNMLDSYIIIFIFAVLYMNILFAKILVDIRYEMPFTFYQLRFWTK